MKSIHSKILVAATVATVVTFTLTARAAAAPADASAASAKLVRGQYVVDQVGLCADCHSPRDQTGQFVTGQWLKGAVLPFAPTVPMPVWAPVAPPIAGLPTMTEAQAVKFLQTGLKPDGTMARPPMPQFRLDQADAEAVAAYLKSLTQVP